MKAELRNWSLALITNGPYDAPETGYQALCGEVYGHPRFKNGEKVTTSRLVDYDGEYFITNSGTKYLLKDVNFEYESLYPNAKERLIKTIQEKKK